MEESVSVKEEPKQRVKPVDSLAAFLDTISDAPEGIGAFLGHKVDASVLLRAWYKRVLGIDVSNLPDQALFEKVFSPQVGDLIVLSGAPSKLAIATDVGSFTYCLWMPEGGVSEITDYTFGLVEKTESIWRLKAA